MFSTIGRTAGVVRQWLWLGLLLCTLSHGQAPSSAVSLSYLEGQVPVAPDAFTTLGTDLFGDKVNLFNGSLEFEQTDTHLPGNSALPVAIVRRYQPGRNESIRGQFGDWDLETPRIGGVFAYSAGWVVGTGGTQGRCSAYGLPPVVYAAPSHGGIVVAVNFIANDYHQGVHIAVPGMGRQEVLRRAPAYTAAPTDGQVYPLVTREQWQISCLPGVLNGTGEGFLAVSPQGVRYRFDWMSSRWQPELQKDGAVINRQEISLHATEVTDRFGNWVRFTYDPTNPMLLTRIQSSDGRLITVDNVNGLATTVSDGSRTLTYRYNAYGSLNAIELPDSSRWTFDLNGLTAVDMSDMGQGATCENPGTGPSDDLIGSMTHPSGATGRFKMNFAYHGRTYVDKVCRRAPFWPNPSVGAVYPKLVISQTLMEKTITGPGLPTLTWFYQHGGPQGWNPCTGCGDRKTVVVTEPDGQYKAYEFGVRWRVNEGQLMGVYEGWTGTAWQRSTATRYRTADGQAFPDQFGTSLLRNSAYLAARNRPLDQRVTTQQGATFTWEAAAGAAGLDSLARPLSVTLASSLGYSKTETTAYFDHPGKWVMGQVASVTDNWGSVQHSTSYDATTAMPIAKYNFGLLKESYTYYADGTLYQRLDPLGRATTRANYKRGIPQNVTHRDNTQESGTVNNLGKLGSHTNEAGTTTYYAYDNMGRLNRVDYPSETGLSYHHTERTHEAVPTPEFGLTVGHWRQTTSTGSARTVRYYDALWRVRLIQSSDVRDEAGTAKVVEFRYDHDGQQTFESSPQRNLPSVDTAVAGRSWLYDGLNRVVQVRQNSEVGDLTTTTEFLPGFMRRVTNPRGYATTFNFQAYDQPSEDQIVGIGGPDNTWLAIYRDIHGKPLSIVRGGTYAGAAQQATRSYVYDANQRLCKTIEPETGATVQAYDGAGTLAWRASGLSLPGNACEQGSVPEARKVSFGYDPRDRLMTTTFGDGNPGISRSYTLDGQLARVSTNNTMWAYEYYNRGLLKQERYTWWANPNPNEGWYFDWSVDPHGNVDALTDPWGAMAYAPNALGQPTQISGYASNVTYHPNGAVAGYTLNNGIGHSMRQNARGLPEELRDFGVTADRYSYDANGNVAGILDQQEGVSSRSMSYDALDRLTAANGSWGGGVFSYDALDNLRSSTVGGRNLTHNTDGNNRLVSWTGSQNISIGYDANGNVIQRGSQAFVFDIANRMQSAPGKANAYVYDGHGRRSQNFAADGTWRLYTYGRDGKLRFGYRSDQGHTRYVYLGDKLISETTATATTFSHTDALGSPVATTNSIGALLSRTRYEPYGATASGTNPAKIGFTGHVNEVDTGLVYMQQRYYEPIAGRFLSVDPVTTDAKTGGHFNRYVYGENNPYKFKDPDGRAPQLIEESKHAGRPGIGQGQTNADGGPVRLGSRAERNESLQASREATAARTEGRYEFPDKSAGNKPYVGQSCNCERRLGEHQQAGRYESGTAKVTPVEGGKPGREVSEHKRIQEITGGVPARQSDAVSNKVDPIGPARQHLLKENK